MNPNDTDDGAIQAGEPPLKGESPPDKVAPAPPEAPPTSAPAGFAMGVAGCFFVFALTVVGTGLGGYLGFQPKGGHDDGFGILDQLFGAGLGALLGAFGAATVGLGALFASARWASGK